MPKQRITREMVINAGFEIARKHGMEGVMVKTIADTIGCSVQPIYSYCQNMDSLRQEVAAKTSDFIRKYIGAHTDPKDLFRSTGKAYIRLAEEEPHLFKIFILHRRDGISSLQDLYEKETSPKVSEYIAEELNISISQAKQLHLNMLIYTIGMGTIFAMTTPGIPLSEIHTQQELACQAFLAQILNQKEKDFHGK